jgi:hypothetical protein
MEESGQLHAPAALTSGERALGTQWTEDSVGPRAGPEALAKREIPYSCWESDPGRLTRSLVTILNNCLGSYILP